MSAPLLTTTMLTMVFCSAAASATPPPPPPFPSNLCPTSHIHGSIHDPSGARDNADTKLWHLLLDAAPGGVGHEWSADLVHWSSDQTYPVDKIANVPETGSVTVTAAGMFFVYAGLGGRGAAHEQGAFRAVSTDPKNW